MTVQEPIDRLPRGPHTLPRAQVEGSQRRRIVNATARLVAERGYDALRVADIARLAGVSRSTIYTLFKDKEAVFLACYQAGSNTHRAAVEAAFSATGTAEKRLKAAVNAYLQVLDDDPLAARAFLVEPQRSTVRVRARFRANQRGYIALLEAWHADWRAEHQRGVPAPQDTWSAILHGIVGLITERLEEQPTARVGGLAEPITELIFALARAH